MVLSTTATEVPAPANSTDTTETATAGGADIESLVAPFGVVAGVRRLTVPRGLGRINVYMAAVGGGQPGHAPLPRQQTGMDGCGRAYDDPEHARLIAIAEAAERYSAGDFLGEPVVWATAAELDGAVLDPASVPRCSAREYERPGCPVRPFDPDATIRWVSGTDLATGEPIWVPAVLACFRLGSSRPEENFSYRISTGNAVHTNLPEALVQGICEVVERDAFAVAWLQKMALPLVTEEVTSELIEYVLDWGRKHFVATYLLDATTDIGLPTVVCLQVAQYDRRARHTVGLGTGRSTTEAAERAMLEALIVRDLYASEEPLPDDFAEFLGAEQGARFMGAPERSEAFRFLLDGVADRPRRTRPPWPDEPTEMLARLIDRLTGNGMRAIAVDRTPRELADAGLTAVNVLIPDLQPLSLAPLAQFRAHPRLHALPMALGYPSYSEQEQNRWPQPLA